MAKTRRWKLTLSSDKPRDQKILLELRKVYHEKMEEIAEEDRKCGRVLRPDIPRDFVFTH